MTTTRTLLLRTLTLLLFPIVWVLVLNVEKLAETNGWDGILLAISRLPMTDIGPQILTSWPAFYAAIFMLGAVFGAWLFWLAIRFDRRRDTRHPVEFLSNDTKQQIASEAQPAPVRSIPDNWRDAYRGRDVLRLHEAASLLSGVHPTQSDTEPRYSARFEQIKLAILEGQMDHDFGEPSPIAGLGISIHGEHGWENWRESKLTP